MAGDQSTAARRGRARSAALLAAFLAVAGGILFLGSTSGSGPAAGATAPTAATATGPGPALTVATGHATFRPGAAVPLTFSVSNQAATACTLANVADGSLIVSSATRNGTSLIPTYSDAKYLDGTLGLLAGHLANVAPRHSVAFTVEAGGPRGLEVLTPVLGQSELIASWPTAASGSYRFQLAYQVTPLAGDQACAGESNIATVAFRVGDPASRHWLSPLVGAAALGVLLLLAAALGWRRRRRTRRRRALGPAAATAVITVLAATLAVSVVVHAAPAWAGVTFNPGSGPDSAANTAAYNTCVGRIGAFDPGLFPSFNRAGAGLTIDAANATRTTQNPDSRGSTILWDPNYRDALPGDEVIADPCASLYHELVHAEDIANGLWSDVECDDTGIADNEVYATLAENAYREANGLEPRQSYGSDALPSSMAACTPPTPGHPGSLNGDPHLTTFDGRHYDFQAVGEFTAVMSSAGDLTVQVRQAAFEGSRAVAVNSAVAIQISGTRLGFYLSDGIITVHRAGAAVEVAAGSTALPNGATLARIDDPYRGAEYVLTWADGSTAALWRAGVYGIVVTVAPAPSRAKTLSGLLGNFDGDPNNDVATRDGKVISPSFAALYPAFADSWRVTATTSLFDYSPGTSTATFTDRSFPDQPATAAGLSSGQRQAALTACTAAGISEPTDRDNCLLDVALTGSVEYAVSAAAIEQSVFPGASSKGGPTSPAAAPTSTLSVSHPDSVAHFTFPATRGERVHVQVTATTLPDQCSALTLRGPDDNVLATGCTKPGDAVDGFLLPSNGVYSVNVDPTGGAVGSITLRVGLSQDAVVSTTIGGAPVTASIAQPGDQAQVHFTGLAGQKVFVDAADATLPDQCGALELSGPGNDELALGCLTSTTGFIDGTVLPTTGAYTVIVNPVGEATGSVNVRLIADHDEHLHTAIGSPALTAAIAEPGAAADITFDGSAGQQITVLGSASTLPNECDITLVAPNQSVLKELCASSNTGPLGTVTLPVGGSYTIVVDPRERGVGQIDLGVES